MVRQQAFAPKSLMVGLLLVLGLAVDGGAVSAAPTSVQPAIDDAMVPDTAQLGPTDVTETVAADDVVRIPLVAGGASGIGLELGEPFVVTIALGPDAVGFDGLLSFDADAVEFGGARAVTPGTALISNEQPDGAVSLAAFVEADAEPTAAKIEVRLTTAAAGQVEVSFEAFDSIAADGSVSSAGATLSTVVSVADGTNAIDAPEVDMRPAEGVAQVDVVTDLTGNGVVDETDLAELQLGWDELIAGGDTCDTSTDRLKTLDANGDGCLGVEDFAAVSDDVVPAARTAAASSMSAPAAPPIIVNVTTDTGLVNFTNNICETTAGGCSLRGAIQQANVSPGPNRIEFDIPGNGPHTIQINDQLPTLNDVSGGTTIDGYTEPGSAVNTHPLQSNAILKIIIAPATIVTDRAAIAISSSDNVIRGLSIINAPRKINMVGPLAARNHVVGNFIGTDPTGTFSDSSGDVRLGVRMVDGAHHNVIGTPKLADRNVITGNRTWGLRVEQNNTDYNVIQNNIVGLRPDGSDDLPQGGGIDVQFGAEYTLIGGNAQYEHNVFSGLNTAGVDNSHNSFNNRTIGNYIGTDLTGTFSNNDLRNYRGIWLKDDARLNEFRDNIIAGNQTDGIYNKHNYTGANTIINNRIGTGIDGTPVGNGDNGAVLRGHDDVYARNVIANNGGDGIALDSNNDSGANANETTERDLLTQNSFFNNGQNAIDIAGSGTQGGIAAPGNLVAVDGSVTGQACAGCIVEVYLADPGESDGEGRQYLADVLVDGGGSFTLVDPRIKPDGAVTAIAIDAVANTSEFSSIAVVPGSSTLTTWTGLAGTFSASTFQGQQLANTPDNGVFNTGGGANTSSKVTFTLNVPVAGDYYLDGEVFAPNTSSNSHWVMVDGNAAGEVAWGLPTSSSSLLLDTVNQSNGGADVLYNLSAGTHTVTVSLREDGSGIARLGLRSATPGGGVASPVVSNPGNLSHERNSAVSVPTSATPAAVTFWALNLPDGLDIDPDTGIMSGTPTRAGTFEVTLWATNVAGISSTTFEWVIINEPQPPTVTPIANRTDKAGDTVMLQVDASDANGDTITYSQTGLPGGLAIDANTGLISGTITTNSTTQLVFAVTVTASDVDGSTAVTFNWTVEPGFACSVTGNVLSWTDIGATTYYVRLALGTSDTYLGSSNTLSYVVPSQYGVYKVTAFINGTQVTTCDAPGGTTAPAFECSVTGNVLSWTDIGATTYYVRLALGTSDTYLGSSNTLSYVVPSQYGVYKVTAFINGTQVTYCDAPGGPTAP